MNAISPRIKKALRQYANRVYEVELHEALLNLADTFEAWKAQQLSDDELSEAIHRFHNGTARDLYKKYTYTPLNMLVAHAIVTGFLRREEMQPDVLAHLATAIAFYENQQQSGET